MIGFHTYPASLVLTLLLHIPPTPYYGVPLRAFRPHLKSATAKWSPTPWHILGMRTLGTTFWAIATFKFNKIISSFFTPSFVLEDF